MTENYLLQCMAEGLHMLMFLISAPIYIVYQNNQIMLRKSWTYKHVHCHFPLRLTLAGNQMLAQVPLTVNIHQ